MVQSVGLGIQVPDFGRSLAQGFQLRAASEQMEGQNALRAMLAQPGVTQGLLAGDPNILAQIAGLGQQGLQVAAPIMANTQQRQDMLAARAEDRDFRERDFRLREEAARRAAAAAGQVNLQPIPGADGQMYAFNPRTGQATPMNMAVPQTPDEFSRLLAQSGIQPGTPQAQELARGILERRAAPAQPQVVVNQGDNSYDREMAQQAARAIGQSRDEAQTGMRLVQSSQRVTELLPQAITGPGADARLLFARIGAGLGVRDAGQAVEATQTLMAELARGTLAQAESLKGVLSDRDMDLLRQAAGGDINLDAASIRRIASLSEMAGRAAVERYNSTLANARLPEAAAAVFRPFDLPPARGAAPPPSAQPSAPGAPVRVSTPEEARALPPGTPILLPDGTLGTVPPR